MKYKSPKKTNKEFTKYWTELAPIITEKEGFDESCLKNLEILCTLYVVFDKMTKYIEDSDMVVETEGRYGLQIKPNPVINERQKVLGEIRHFSKLLGMKIGNEAKIPDDIDSDDWNL